MTDLEYAQEKACLLANILAAQLCAGELARQLRFDGQGNAVTRHAFNALHMLTKAHECAVQLPPSIIDRPTPGNPECLHEITVHCADGRVMCVHCAAVVARTH